MIAKYRSLRNVDLQPIRLHTIDLENVPLGRGKTVSLPISFQYFGPQLGTAPIVLVNHALTGNSLVAGELGWWNKMIGEGKTINTHRYTVLAFNIPGNGYDHFFINDYQDFICNDIANMFLLGLNRLNINKLHSIIGGSLGGAIGWHMLMRNPELSSYFIPIATDWKTTDWLHSVCLVQEDLLQQDHFPIEKARRHAMLCYRTPQSLNTRFDNNILKGKNIRKSQDWLDFHGNQLKNRFSIKSYRLMNQLLKTIAATDTESTNCYKKLSKIDADIHLVAIDSDMLFPKFEILRTFENLKSIKENIHYHEIQSPHGHDAFLMEYNQLEKIVRKIYKD